MGPRDRQNQKRLGDLELRNRRLEQMTRRLASMHGLTIEELEAEESPALRNGWPHTHAELVVYCRMHGFEAPE